MRVCVAYVHYLFVVCSNIVTHAHARARAYTHTHTQVMFKTAVSITDNPKINQWLTLVEKAMRMNLATLLAQAVEDTTHFQVEAIDSARYISWVDKYQVSPHMAVCVCACVRACVRANSDANVL